jgi:hypothetical protein
MVEVETFTIYPLGEFDDYDISEFLAYTIIPFIVILSIKLKNE